MTRAQALQLSQALEAHTIAHNVQLRFDAGGVETWSVALDTAPTYNGDQLSALADYCVAHALTLTLQVQAMGVV